MLRAEIARGSVGAGRSKERDQNIIDGVGIHTPHVGLENEESMERKQAMSGEKQNPFPSHPLWECPVLEEEAEIRGVLAFRGWGKENRSQLKENKGMAVLCKASPR
jgi:hypothetical protein